MNIDASVLKRVSENWKDVQKRVAKAAKISKRQANEVCVIGVSKLQKLEIVAAGIHAGVKDLGENYVQEFLKKKNEFADKNLCWHLIGSLQSNKVKMVVGQADYIHTVDRLSLADAISKCAAALGAVQKVFIQVNVADEDSKSGVSPVVAESLAKSLIDLKGIELVGLMAMPPFVENAEESRTYFAQLRELRDKLNASVCAKHPIKYLSMGTSQDFEVAIEEGATHVRIGSTIFGERGAV